jgi:hypothetical protein
MISNEKEATQPVGLGNYQKHLTGTGSSRVFAGEP